MLKMGEMGSFARDSREEVCMPSFKVDVKDTTGAGDAFVGGFWRSKVMERYNELHKRT